MAIGAVAGAVMGLVQGSDQEKRQAKAYKEQVKAAVQNYNYGDQQVNLDLANARDQASAELAQTQANSIQNLATIRASVYESGMEGSSMDRVMRIAKGSDLRAEDSIRDGFGKSVAGALLSKQVNRTNAQSSLNGLRSQIENSQPSATAQMVSLVGQGMEAYSRYKQGQAQLEALSRARSGQAV
ncbi:virion core protein, T7 gp14 family [Pseudomonas sp. Marseille-Q7302]